MPIYEYQCKKCGYKFEQLQKITDEPLRICPQCKKVQLAKLMSNTSFQLKGTGWYVTDFKNKTTGDNKEQPISNNGSAKKETKKTEKPKNIEKK